MIDRSAREPTLTPTGTVFLRYAGAGMTALMQGADSLAQASGRESGR